MYTIAKKAKKKSLAGLDSVFIEKLLKPKTWHVGFRSWLLMTDFNACIQKSIAVMAFSFKTGFKPECSIVCIFTSSNGWEFTTKQMFIMSYTKSSETLLIKETWAWFSFRGSWHRR